VPDAAAKYGGLDEGLDQTDLMQRLAPGENVGDEAKIKKFILLSINKFRNTKGWYKWL
jgi:hypothetical protein